MKFNPPDIYGVREAIKAWKRDLSDLEKLVDEGCSINYVEDSDEYVVSLLVDKSVSKTDAVMDLVSMLRKNLSHRWKIINPPEYQGDWKGEHLIQALLTFKNKINLK